MHKIRARLIDALIFVLILFPIFGGGFWIARPHFKFELTELAVPTLVVFVLAVLLRVSSKESFFARQFESLFSRWTALLTSRPKTSIAAVTFLVGVLWAFSSLKRHWNLESNSFDLGIFTNAIWNLTHGHGYVSSVKGGMNLFADHQSPIFWAVAPIFSLFPTAETLLVIQALALAAGAGAVYALGRQYDRSGRSSWWLAALPILYWAYLPIRRANAFDFHPEVFMLPLFLWAIAGIQSRSHVAKILGWIAFLAALGCKESAGPIAAGIGLAWFVGASPRTDTKTRPRRSVGVIAAALGVATFLFDLKVVPSLLGGQYVYGSLYSHLSLGPSEWLRSLAGLSRWKFLFATLAPLGFLPLLSPRVMIAVLPAYLMLFLTEGTGRLNPSFHYGIEVAVGLFWALAASSSRFDSRIFKKISPALWITFWALFSFGRSEIYWIRHNEPTEHTHWLTSEMLRCLSSDTRLTASSPLVPQVATREWIQQIPDLAQNDCVWIDDSVKPWPLNSDERDAWEKRLTLTEGFQKFYECGPTRVYQRQSFSGACLRCLPLCPNSN